MATENDRRLIKEMMKLPGDCIGQYFAENAHRIEDNAVYWNVLGTLWKLGGTVVQQDLWLRLFRSNRKQQHKIMKSRERKKWRRLPKIFVAYRAVNCEEEIEAAISWSLSRDTVEKLFVDTALGKRVIVEREFRRSDVFAFFDRRGEDEIIVNI